MLKKLGTGAKNKSVIKAVAYNVGKIIYKEVDKNRDFRTANSSRAMGNVLKFVGAITIDLGLSLLKAPQYIILLIDLGQDGVKIVSY